MQSPLDLTMEPKNPSTASTKYSAPETMVIQILPESTSKQIEVNGRSAHKMFAQVFIPNSPSGQTLSCPLSYFQENASLPGKWMRNDNSEYIALRYVDNIKRVIVTTKIKEVETSIEIPEIYSERLLNYFLLDIHNNQSQFINFDCFALACLLANVKYNPAQPEFSFKKGDPKPGGIVVLSDNGTLPGSIKHWAMYLGNDMYLSKFGRSGQGTQSLVEIMNLNGMLSLYECNDLFIAEPKTGAEKWDGYN